MLIWLLTILGYVAFAQADAPPPREPESGAQYDPSVSVREVDREKEEAAVKMEEASAKQVRQFHDVLNDLLSEFAYDVKQGQIKGLKNLSIRHVSVSQAIPKTYESYVEMLVAERIRENSQVRLLSCVPCKSRTSQLVDGRLVISSPVTNMARLESAAQQLGIENWMDVVLVYHTTHMVLAFNVFESTTKELLWARTYNSETIRSRYQKLAIDFSQIAKSKGTEEYVPEYRIMAGLGGGALPNVGGTEKDAAMLAFHVRATEKFNNRKSEFGLILGLYNSLSALLTEYPSEKPEGTTEQAADEDTEVVVSAVPKPFSNALTLWGIYSHQFVGAVESYNDIRHGLHGGVGFLFATGYLAPSLRFGWDMYFGRRFAASIGGIYLASSTVVVDGVTQTTNGGAGVDVLLSFNF
jgi:hypothetical protein